MSGLDLIARDDVDVVHICTPNATHANSPTLPSPPARPSSARSRWPLNPDSATSLVDQATAAGVVNAVPFIYRYYPTVREARDRISRDEAGPLWLLHGSYLQDWLSGRQVSNWRVDPKLGGTSRAFGDIGVHWCDLMEFVTGHRITSSSPTGRTPTPSDRHSDTPGVADGGRHRGRCHRHLRNRPGRSWFGGGQPGFAGTKEPAVVLLRRPGRRLRVRPGIAGQPLGRWPAGEPRYTEGSGHPFSCRRQLCPAADRSSAGLSGFVHRLRRGCLRGRRR